MKKLFTIAIVIIASLEATSQMTWIANTLYNRDSPNQFFNTKTGHYLISHSSGIKLVNSNGFEVMELTTAGVFPNEGSHATTNIIESPDLNFAVGTYSYGADPASGEGWAYSSIIRFDQNGNGTLLASDFNHQDYGSLEAVLSDGNYVVLYYSWGLIVLKDANGDPFKDISLPGGASDLLATPEDSIIAATGQGLVTMDRFGNIANTYPAFVFKQIKLDGLNRIVGVNDSTITLLSTSYQKLNEIVLAGEVVKDFCTNVDSVALLTTTNKVKLYTSDLSFNNEFQLQNTENNQFIAMNKGWIALAGEEVCGDVQSNQYSTTSFIKEYSMEGISVNLSDDIGVAGIYLGSNILIEQSVDYPNLYGVTFPDAEITVHNFGMTPVEKFYLRHQTNAPLIHEATLLPDGEVAVPYPNLRIWTTNGHPSGTTVNVCVWSSQPNLSFDSDATNDLFCTNFLVGSKEDFSEGTFTLSPNPVSNILNCSITAEHSSPNTIFRIAGTDGRVVMEGTALQNGESNFSIPVDDWAPGIYCMQLWEEGSLRAARRFVVVH